MSVLQPQHGGRAASYAPGWRRPVVDRTQTSLVKSLLRRQYDRPDRSAALKIAVGLSRVVERIV